MCVYRKHHKPKPAYIHAPTEIARKKNSPNVFYGKYMFPFPSNSNNNNKKTRLGFNFILTNDFLKKAFFKSFYISFAWFDLIRHDNLPNIWYNLREVRKRKKKQTKKHISKQNRIE